MDPGPSMVVPSINQERNAQTSPLQHQKDLHYLAEQCQHHTHKETCYKYCRAPLDEKQCQFDLD
jgi:hypothetical protein